MSNNKDNFMIINMEVSFIENNFNNVKIKLDIHKAEFVLNHINSVEAFSDYVKTMSSDWIWEE